MNQQEAVLVLVLEQAVVVEPHLRSTSRVGLH
jgi:hypothetical protein